MLELRLTFRMVYRTVGAKNSAEIAASFVEIHVSDIST